VHDDLWTIDVVHATGNHVCVDSTAFDSSICHAPTENNMTALLTPWLPLTDTFYGEQPRLSLSQSQGNTCPAGFAADYCSLGNGECIAGGGSAFCHCNSYTQGARCDASNLAEVKAKLQLGHGSVLLAGDAVQAVLPFAAVAHRPGTGEVYSFGGAVVDSHTGSAFASAAFTRVDMIANTVFQIPRTPGYAVTHEYSQMFIPTLQAGGMYVAPMAPPPSLESHAWFSPDGANMYLYADSFVAPPGLWVYSVQNKVRIEHAFDDVRL